jgi:hypothetical protein
MSEFRIISVISVFKVPVTGYSFEDWADAFLFHLPEDFYDKCAKKWAVVKVTQFWV